MTVFNAAGQDFIPSCGLMFQDLLLRLGAARTQDETERSLQPIARQPPATTQRAFQPYAQRASIMRLPGQGAAHILWQAAMPYPPGTRQGHPSSDQNTAENAWPAPPEPASLAPLPHARHLTCT